MGEKAMYKIAVIPGDGTGPEVIREGLKVLEAVSQIASFKYEARTYDLVEIGILRRVRSCQIQR